MVVIAKNRGVIIMKKERIKILLAQHSDAFCNLRNAIAYQRISKSNNSISVYKGQLVKKKR